MSYHLSTCECIGLPYWSSCILAETHEPNPACIFTENYFWKQKINRLIWKQMDWHYPNHWYWWLSIKINSSAFFFIRLIRLYHFNYFQLQVYKISRCILLTIIWRIPSSTWTVEFVRLLKLNNQVPHNYYVNSHFQCQKKQKRRQTNYGPYGTHNFSLAMKTFLLYRFLSPCPYIWLARETCAIPDFIKK